MFLGYSEGVKGYRLWNIERKGAKIIMSRDVTFNENEFPYYHDINPFAGENSIPYVITNKFQVEQREMQVETRPTFMDNQVEVKDNVRVELAGREEDVEHLDHEDGE